MVLGSHSNCQAGLADASQTCDGQQSAVRFSQQLSQCNQLGIPPDPGYVACHELTHYTHEKQIAGLTQRIAGGRAAGIDTGALSGIEHGLAEVRDVLRGLTPAENLVGQENKGWDYAKFLLVHERSSMAGIARQKAALKRLKEFAAHEIDGGCPPPGGVQRGSIFRKA